MEKNGPEQKIGRPKSKADNTDLKKLPLDPITWKMLEELEVYGRLGTTKQEIVKYILRSWLWENEARLRAGIAAKESPFGPRREPE